MKYLKLSKEQILISIDRLTRFKNTKEKYLRVFCDILSSNLIEPKLKKTEIISLDFSQITEWVSIIINDSLGNVEVNTKINDFIKNYENQLFVNDIETQKLLNNNINYLGIANLISDDMPINLVWLKNIIKNVVDKKLSSINNEILSLRREKLLKFPIEQVILVEGITEEILLPKFSQYLGFDFYAEGIQVIAAGGKNQVVKMYYQLARELKIPIFVLLDNDAEDNIEQIKPRLRYVDKIHLLSCGEFEDLLPKTLIIKTVNSHFENFLSITEADLDNNLSNAKSLEELFKTKGLHEFKKAEFAKLVRDMINSDNDISLEIRNIIEEIRLTK
jgi:hypothetical protein